MFGLVNNVKHFGRLLPHRRRQGVRLLTVLDEYTKECLAIWADRRIRSADVIETLVELMMIRGVPGWLLQRVGRMAGKHTGSTPALQTSYLNGRRSSYKVVFKGMSSADMCV